MSLIFATQLTAVATAVLAVFAVLTAVFAGLAFRKQSQEVKDEQELLEVQSGQLEVQRRQLEEQREINELQIKDLRESLRAAEREQADNIDFQMSAMPFPRYVDDADEDFAAVADQEVHLAIVSNESRRPIKNVKCRIGGAPCPEIPDAHSPFAVVVGRLAASEPGERRGPTGSCSRPAHIAPWTSLTWRSGSPMTPVCAGRSTATFTWSGRRTMTGKGGQSSCAGCFLEWAGHAQPRGLA